MTTQTAPAVSTWEIDPYHSTAEFTAKHMMVATVKGRFKIANGTLNIDEGRPERSTVTASIDVASVDSGVADRDAHLRSNDFFNAEKYPYFTFRSTRIEPGDGGNWRMHGDLTIRDVTRPVVLDVELEGRGVDAYGKDRAGFTATTKINRRDFGVNWNGVIEAGGVIVGDTVRITLHVAATRQE
jgi:polyisoprenoid-binding protein YceI